MCWHTLGGEGYHLPLGQCVEYLLQLLFWLLLSGDNGGDESENGDEAEKGVDDGILVSGAGKAGILFRKREAFPLSDSSCPICLASADPSFPSYCWS